MEKKMLELSAFKLEQNCGRKVINVKFGKGKKKVITLQDPLIEVDEEENHENMSDIPQELSALSSEENEQQKIVNPIDTITTTEDNHVKITVTNNSTSETITTSNQDITTTSSVTESTPEKLIEESDDEEEVKFELTNSIFNMSLEKFQNLAPVPERNYRRSKTFLRRNLSFIIATAIFFGVFLFAVFCYVMYGKISDLISPY
ncbi:hypothetical protein GWI33_017421 [Rhynchophorus ferrugineus]|uniref:Uncharacterized protein n=1 Tax=Rhynchophorus ferrugineus TaxID=354439 RepID=A0A834HZS2_RHYFE|nr:hypothetical protein GWI33_017421 [Rhynchophorus ferrugineus]